MGGLIAPEIEKTEDRRFNFVFVRNARGTIEAHAEHCKRVLGPHWLVEGARDVIEAIAFDAAERGESCARGPYRVEPCTNGTRLQLVPTRSGFALRLAKMSRAQVAVEAALISVPLLIIFLMVIQIMVGFAVQSSLDWNARQASQIVAQGSDPSSFLAANLPNGATYTTACGGGLGTVAISYPTTSITFLPAVPAWPSTLTSQQSAASVEDSCS